MFIALAVCSHLYKKNIIKGSKYARATAGSNLDPIWAETGRCLGRDYARGEVDLGSEQRMAPLGTESRA